MTQEEIGAFMSKASEIENSVINIEQNTSEIKTNIAKTINSNKECNCSIIIGIAFFMVFVCLCCVVGAHFLFIKADNSLPASIICATVIICCAMVCAVIALAIIAKSYIKRKEASAIKNNSDKSAEILGKTYEKIINGKNK